jgi:iron complex outermembrane receptor protein
MISPSLSRLLASSAFVGGLAPLLLGLAAPAEAQNTAIPAAAPSTGPAAPAAADDNAIVVTGTLIHNANLTSSTPVLVTDHKEIELRQPNTAEELLRDIPGIVPGIGSAVNNGNNGYSTINLRGLGDNRNVVLLDGKRIVPATLTGVTDLNDIPLALVDRVEVLTGGASTTYGADAVSGVVNFITRRNFAGFEADASEQLTQRGDGNVRRLEATTGVNTGDGRGNVVIGIGYQKSDAVFEGDRGFSRDAIASGSGTTGGSSTTPETTFNFGAGGNKQLSGGALVPAFTTYNFNPFNILQTPFKRYNFFGEGHYEVSDNIEVYTRGLYSRNTVSSIVAPSGSFGNTFNISLSNPFLPAGFAAQACALNPANCTPTTINGVVIKRRTPELGNRTSVFKTDIFDYNLGVRGDVNSHVKFDVYGSYGQSDNTQTFGGYADLKRLQQGLTLDAAGNCTDTSNGCVPIDIFGPPGSISAAQAAFLTVQSTTEVSTSLAQFHAGLDGDLGFSSPAAHSPVSFAVGGEYRRYKATQSADLIAEQPGELGGAGAAVIPFSAKYDVSEAFAELNAPLVQDKPFFQDLTFDAGARYSHYKIFDTTNRFNTTTYKGGLVWEPVKGVKFRGDFSHAVRAPNINELFEPTAVGLSNLFADPCAGSAPLTNANLAAICVAQGAPRSNLGSIANPSAAQPNILNSGNVNLKPEKANTYTLGAVFEPHDQLPGFTATVDYYHIKITHAISAPSASDSSAACFANITAASASSPACLAIHRDPTTGGLDGDQSGTGTGFPGLLTNSGQLLTNGIDVKANYNRSFGEVHLGLSFDGNYTFKSKFRSTPGGIDRECVGYYSAGCGIGGGESIGSLQPKFQWSQRTSLGLGGTTLSLLWRHIDKMKYEPRSLADQLTAASLDTADCGTDFATTDTGGCVIDPRFRKIKAADYFDLTLQFVTTEHFTLTFEVENLLDRKPPIVGSDVGNTAYNSGNTYPSTYDALGRRFVATAKVAF